MLAGVAQVNIRSANITSRNAAENTVYFYELSKCTPSPFCCKGCSVMGGKSMNV